MAIKIDYSPVDTILNGASAAGNLQGLGQLAGQRRQDAANGIQTALRQAEFNLQLQQQRDLQQNQLNAQAQHQQLGNEQEAMTGGYYRKQDDVNKTDASTAANALQQSQVKRNTAQAMLDEFKATQAQAKATTPAAPAKEQKVDNSAAEFNLKKYNAAEKAYQGEQGNLNRQIATLNSTDPSNPHIAELQKRVTDLDTKLSDVRAKRDAVEPAVRQTANPAQPGNPTLANPTGTGYTVGANAKGQPVLTMNGNQPAAQPAPVVAPEQPLSSEEINAIPLPQRQASVVQRLASDPALTASIRNIAADNYKKEDFKGLGISFDDYLHQVTQNLGTRGPLDKTTAGAILQQAGGDKTKARALAIFNGWVVDSAQ